MTVARMIELLEIEHECMLRGALNVCDRNCADCELVQNDAELHEMYLNVIDMIKNQEANEWISVKDKLPEARHAVLGYAPYYNNIWAVSLHEDGEWYHWHPFPKKYNQDTEGSITHWMPLPKAPQKGL